MEIQKDLCNNELRKIGLLIAKAGDLGMDLSYYGVAGVNSSSGNTYLWIEDYPFTLFIDLSGDDIIQACWSNFNNGDEEIINVENKSLYDLERWAAHLDLAANGLEILAMI